MLKLLPHESPTDLTLDDLTIQYRWVGPKKVPFLVVIYDKDNFSLRLTPTMAKVFVRLGCSESS